MNYCCNKWKDGRFFATHSFTNSTSGEENLQKLREIIAKKKTKILGIQDQFELHKQSLLDDREKMKKEIETLKQQSQYEVKLFFETSKGQVILKGHFEVFKFTKNPTNCL